MITPNSMITLKSMITPKGAHTQGRAVRR